MQEDRSAVTRASKESRLTRLECHWIGYDIGNSAFTLLLATVLPIYFNSIAKETQIPEAAALGYWGYATSLTTLLVVLLGPVLGSISDQSGKKRSLFFISVLAGVVTMLALSLPLGIWGFLILLIAARIGYQISLIFYDSMLPDITSPERMDRISSYGYALGYIGSCVPFILSLLVLLKQESFGLDMGRAMAIVLLINAFWWLVFTLPLLRSYRQPDYGQAATPLTSIPAAFRSIFSSIREIAKDRKLYLFLLAFFFFIDGVYTIIDMAVAYGGSLGLDSTQLLLALLVTQFVAFPCAILFGFLAKRFPNHVLIQVCIIGYALIAAFAVQLDKVWEFWFLAICVGLFQGGIQALSRSYFASLIPPEKSGEFFGIYDIFGKGASFTGTFLVGFISHVSGRQNFGIVAIVVLFVVGFFLFRASVAESRRA